MPQIVNIPIERLRAHEQNPRKHVGDVTELAESIKANGVLQNLTVVPYVNKDGEQIAGIYTVIIGHRRMAAARLAGLKELPCTITKMTYKEQISTMLTENMQRSDLTFYEQAQGFQMMLDMGDTIAQVAEKSGFSESTVRRRVKLLELDKGALEQAERRGATLSDYIMLDQIKSLERRNKVLNTIGTADFNNALATAKREEKREELYELWREVLDTFAEELPNAPAKDLDYIGAYYRENETINVPDDSKTRKYFYRVGKYQVDVYAEHLKKDKAEEAAEKRERDAARQKIDQRNYAIEDISQRHYEMRSDFVNNLVLKPEHIQAVNDAALWALWNYQRISDETLEDVADLPYDNGEVEDFEALEGNPKGLLYATFAALDNMSATGYYIRAWNSDLQTNEYKYTDLKKLDVLYEMLEKLGYEMSEEEKQMQDGTHKVFRK